MKLLRFLVLSLIILIIISCEESPSESKSVVVNIPDLIFEQVIREHLDMPSGEIVEKDLQELKVISADYKDINDIAGIEYCENLEFLSLAGNPIADFTPISNLILVNTLSLRNCNINVITFLSKLVNIALLDLANCNIIDISPLTGITELTQIWLDNNEISDIKALVDNSNLGENDMIWLEGNPLSDTSINIYIPQLEARGVIIYR